MTSNQPWWLKMPPAELAATILPLLATSSHLGEHEAMSRIVGWFRTGSPIAAEFPSRLGPGFCAEFDDPDYRAAAEAMQVLESTRLLVRAVEIRSFTHVYVGLTRLGRHALQTNTVRQHLGLGEATPTT
jgi:hypothetical protein